MSGFRRWQAGVGCVEFELKAGVKSVLPTRLGTRSAARLGFTARSALMI